MTQYNKLVRDKIPALLDAKGIPYELRIASPHELRRWLFEKLVEEAEELMDSGAPEELADVLEVIVALRALPEYADVETLRLKKRTERGGFDQRIILKGEKP